VGVVIDGYCSDLTRMFFLSPLREEEQVWSFLQKVHDHIVKELRPGVAIATLQQMGDRLIREGGYEKGLVHGIGHFLGLEVHEGFRFQDAEDQVLQEGMVLTIEPGIYLPGKFGLRFENLFQITKKGAISFAKEPEGLR